MRKTLYNRLISTPALYKHITKLDPWILKPTVFLWWVWTASNEYLIETVQGRKGGWEGAWPFIFVRPAALSTTHQQQTPVNDGEIDWSYCTVAQFKGIIYFGCFEGLLISPKYARKHTGFSMRVRDLFSCIIQRVTPTRPQQTTPFTVSHNSLISIWLVQFFFFLYCVRRRIRTKARLMSSLHSEQKVRQVQKLCLI